MGQGSSCGSDTTNDLDQADELLKQQQLQAYKGKQLLNESQQLIEIQYKDIDAIIDSQKEQSGSQSYKHSQQINLKSNRAQSGWMSQDSMGQPPTQNPRVPCQKRNNNLKELDGENENDQLEQQKIEMLLGLRNQQEQQLINGNTTNEIIDQHIALAVSASKHSLKESHSMKETSSRNHLQLGIPPQIVTSFASSMVSQSQESLSQTQQLQDQEQLMQQQDQSKMIEQSQENSQQKQSINQQQSYKANSKHHTRSRSSSQSSQSSSSPQPVDYDNSSLSREQQHRVVSYTSDGKDGYYSNRYHNINRHNTSTRSKKNIQANSSTQPTTTTTKASRNRQLIDENSRYSLGHRQQQLYNNVSNTPSSQQHSQQVLKNGYLNISHPTNYQYIQPSPLDLIQNQLLQSQFALAQTQQNHQAQIQSILYLQQQQQQQQQQQMSASYQNIYNQPSQVLLGQQLNALNPMGQFIPNNNQILPVNQNINGNLLQLSYPQQQREQVQQQYQLYQQQQQQQQQPYPIIINNNVISPTKTHIGDLVHLQGNNTTNKNDYEKLGDNQQYHNNSKQEANSIRKGSRTVNNQEKDNGDDDEDGDNDVSSSYRSVKKIGQNTTEIVEKANEKEQNESQVNNNDTFIQQNSNNKVKSKSLAEIFQEKRGKLAIHGQQHQQQQKQQEQEELQQFQSEISNHKSAKKTKEELLRLRHDMMEYGSKVNPKLKAKTQMKNHHSQNDNVNGFAINQGNNSTKAGMLSKEKEELLSRLAQGIKPKISEREMYALTKKNYENLPEVKRKRQEQEKERNKEEMRQIKQEKLKELDEKRRSQTKQKNKLKDISTFNTSAFKSITLNNNNDNNNDNNNINYNNSNDNINNNIINNSSEQALQ